jgi:cyclopropane fatty-acyl-phospholipid synthase-like methyltransferase
MRDISPEMLAEFNTRYQLGDRPVMRRIEARVIGTDYGSTSYTSLAQASQLAEMLDLDPGRLLLDIGSGSGWPALYLARATGCRAILTDGPFDGLRVARRRAEADRLDGQVVAATGQRLPFRDGQFDAVSSSDVLC